MKRTTRRLSKTAAKEAKRNEGPGRKKQQDLRKAMFLATRAKKKADRSSDEYESPTKSIKTVSPEKEKRKQPIAHEDVTTSSSDNLKALQERHAKEIQDISDLEK